MTAIYCRDRHGGEPLCEACQALMTYAAKRLAVCPFGEDKPVCAKCQIHCYGPKPREDVRTIMQREGDVRAASRYAQDVLANPAATLESRYRAFLALGSLHQDAYDYEEASRLYREAEAVVHQLGDDIAMASWLQRAALTQAAHVRQAAALGELDARSLAGAIAALKKSIEFARSLADGPDITLDQLLLAEMKVLQGRPAEALALYDAYLPSAEGEGFLHEVTAAMSDRGHCCIALGRVDEGVVQLETALQRVDESTPSDVRAIANAGRCRAYWRAVSLKRGSSRMSGSGLR